MTNTFETFRPENHRIARYVDYYYLDIKPLNEINEFQCFPHFNNTISLYRSHIRLGDGTIQYKKTAKALQIFTPLRKKVLKVRQSGEVHRVVIVFHPAGVQQFYRGPDFSGYITDFSFFTGVELEELFATTETARLANLLDSFLEKRFVALKNDILERSVSYILRCCESFSVEQASCDLAISRRHLNRIFKSSLGVSVKKFHEIVLFRKTIHQKLFENPAESFTRLAHEFHFNDQSHLNKIYRNLADNPPRSFFSKGTLLGKADTFWHLLS